MNASPTWPSGQGRGRRVRRRAPAFGVCVVIAVVASALSSITGYAATAPQVELGQLAGRSLPPGQLGGPFTAASVVSAEEVLARSGVATVADEKSKVPLVAVVGPVRERFTRAQVESMALSPADDGGIA